MFVRREERRVGSQGVQTGIKTSFAFLSLFIIIIIIIIIIINHHKLNKFFSRTIYETLRQGVDARINPTSCQCQAGAT